MTQKRLENGVWSHFCYTRAVPEIQGDEILNFWSEKCRGFGVATFLSVSPRKKGLKFVTENVTTFFTARKEICHLELTLGASSPKHLSQF